MKANSAIWNRFVSASFCALLALLALVPRANCCCTPEVDNSSLAAQEMHDCCKKESESSINSESVSSKDIHKGSACACVIPLIALTERQTKDASADSQAAAAGAALNEKQESFSQDRSLVNAGSDFRLLALQNDELKPSKIYLLKRALLN